MQAHLSRHLLGRHKNEPEIAEVLLLPKGQQINALSLLRKKGIYEHNKQVLIGDGAGQLQRARCKKVSTDESKSVKICGQCKGVFDRRYISRHRKLCTRDAGKPDISLLSFKALSQSQVPTDGKFCENVVSKLRDDECGLVIRSDRLIQHVGMHYYKTSPKKDRKLVMAHMRRLGNLLIQFRTSSNNSSLTGEDMLHRRNFTALTEALDVVCQKGDESGESK